MVADSNGVVTLPEDNYEDISQVLITIDSPNCETVQISDVYVAGCIGQSKSIVGFLFHIIMIRVLASARICLEHNHCAKKPHYPSANNHAIHL